MEPVDANAYRVHGNVASGESPQPLAHKPHRKCETFRLIDGCSAGEQTGNRGWIPDAGFGFVYHPVGVSARIAFALQNVSGENFDVEAVVRGKTPVLI